ncbi:AbgT family transporter [Brachybacterium sp. AOP29-B2-41]|uniref:AbgT family transporter n=1 Tax=Brachybacterium sp. AOP29-B2-41 TaxID=3457704 RepID=UPI004033B069
MTAELDKDADAPSERPPTSGGGTGILAKFLNTIEVVGNKIPHPLFLFAALIFAVAVASATLAAFGAGAVDAAGERVEVRSLLSIEGIRMAVETSLDNFMTFSPFGTVLVIMIGVSVATQSGYLQALLMGVVQKVPKKLVTFAVSYLAMIAHVAGDASYVIMAPLGAIAFYLVGRNPITGLVLAYVSAGAAYAAAPSVTPSDATFAGLTTEAAQLIEPGYHVSPIDTLFFTAASSLVLALVLSGITELIIDKRVAALGPIDQLPDYFQNLDRSGESKTPRERRAVALATVVLFGFLALLLISIIPSWSPLRTAEGSLEGAPVFAGIAAISATMFMAAGVVYGLVSGKMASLQKDLPKFMAHGVVELAPMIVLFFIISQFTVYFKWTNLAQVMSIEGSTWLQNVDMPIPLLLALIIVVVAILDLTTLGGAAMYAMVGLVLVPMLFSVGIDPETTQTAYRIGDSSMNPTNPINPYFLWVVTLLKKYIPSAGIGTLASMTIPMALGMGVVWMLFFLLWTGLGIPLGP